jgi:hypothetical protein
MILRTSGTLHRAGNTSILRRSLTLVGGLSALILLFAGTQANAAPAHFRYVGGRWSHTRHAGWHRYWGGPSIGFYYAPTPVYIVPGYAAPSYYGGSDFWTSNPSFGISLNFGGGGYYPGGYRSDRYYGGRPHSNYHGDGGHYQVSHHSGGGHYSGSGHSFGGRPSGGGHSFGGGHSSGGGRSSGDRGHR